MLDKVMSSATSFISKITKWIKFPTIPFDQFRDRWMELINSIKGWNMLFPITDVLIIFGLVLAVFSALMIFYIIVLIKSFVPFSGGK